MLRRLLFRTWLVTLAASLLLIGLLYFVGMLRWEPLAGGAPFWIAAAIILAIWGGYNGYRLWRSRKRDQALVKGVTAGADPGSAEVKLLAERLQQCLQRIKETATAEGSRHLSELPWYMLIGPPGSGKTTALAKSGLRFIGLSGRGIEAVSGVGGTRNCDWFFSERAVLIDTAGRFVTQDSDERADRATWLGFLDLLKTHRPRRPINGVIVATSLADLAALSDTARRQQGQTIRERLGELRNRLGVDLPVYVMFTKLDRISGFVEYFDSQKEDRRQVWGFTLPMPASNKDGGELQVEQAKTELQDILANLANRMIDRIYDEPDAGRRGAIYNFPIQMSSLRPAIAELLDEVFGPSRYDRPAILRGVYFTCGLQEGTPIDRVMGVLARSFGLTGRTPVQLGASGRSFFIADLLEKVIFPESNLVGLDPAVERRRKRIRIGAMAGMAALIVAALSVWALSTVNNLGRIQATNDAVPAYQRTVASLLNASAASSDPMPLKDALAQLRGFAGTDLKSVPFGERFGLYQGGVIAEGGRTAYRNGLTALLLPRLVTQLTELMGAGQDNVGEQYRQLKALLMLTGGNPKRIDPGFLKDTFTLIWQEDNIGEADVNALQAHLATLAADLKEDPVTFPVDQRIVDAARLHLRQESPGQRAYEAIKASEEMQSLEPWVLSDKTVGPVASQVLVLRSGRLLSEFAIPGMFTREGFLKLTAMGPPQIASAIDSDSWVLGDRSTPADTAQLFNEVVALYEDEFIARWDQAPPHSPTPGLFEDLAIKRSNSVEEIADELDLLGGASSPLAFLVPAVVAETQLTKEPGALKAAGDVLPGTASRLRYYENQAKRVANDAGMRVRYGEHVQQHFEALARFNGTGGTGSQLNTLMLSLKQAAEELRRGMVPGQDSSLVAALARSEAMKRLKSEITMLRPMSTMIGSLSAEASGAATVGPREQLKGDWNGTMLRDCKRIVDGKYPFQRSDPGPGVPLQDFASLFGPSGSLQSYFTANLKPLIDTRGGNWRWATAGGGDIGLNADMPVQMQRVHDIQNAFFQGGSGAFGFTVSITPTELDKEVTSAELTIDGQTISYSNGPQNPTTIHWPGSPGLSQIRLALIPRDNGPTPTINETGPWAWYRFVDHARVDEGAPGGALRLRFNISGRTVAYDVVGGSVFTPLTAQSLVAFHCPSL